MITEKDIPLSELSFMPPRFRSLEDAQLYMQSYEHGRAFPREKMIMPVVVIDGICALRDEYKNAPFELAYATKPTK